jgi:hypothetical protein
MQQGDTGPENAGLRELAEETGFTSPTHRLIASLCTDPAKFSNRTHLIIATDAERGLTQTLDASEDIEVILVSAKNIFDIVRGDDFINAGHVGMIMLGLYELGLLISSG